MTNERRDGRRVLAISPQLLVEFCKRHDGQHRTYTVENAIPDDARIVGGQIVWAPEHVDVVLESAEWQDNFTTEIERLDPPIFIAIYERSGDDENLS